MTRTCTKDFNDLYRLSNIEDDLENVMADLCVLWAETTDANMKINVSRTISILKMIDLEQTNNS